MIEVIRFLNFSFSIIIIIVTPIFRLKDLFSAVEVKQAKMMLSNKKVENNSRKNLINNETYTIFFDWMLQIIIKEASSIKIKIERGIMR